MGLADRRSPTPDEYRDPPERFSNWGAGDPSDGLGTLSSTSARAARSSAAREARGGSGWEQVILNLIGSPGGREFWEERGYLFGDPFRRHVEGELMKRKLHPRAKPMGAFSIGDLEV